MATETTPKLSIDDVEFCEETQEAMFGKRMCCCWIPCFGSERPSSSEWERIRAANQNEERWWARGWDALKKVRAWSEIMAGPRWKTFIRRFNKSRSSSRLGKFQYDPFSYSLNFDDGPGQNYHSDDDYLHRDFSTRYASIPAAIKPSMDAAKESSLT